MFLLVKIVWLILLLNVLFLILVNIIKKMMLFFLVIEFKLLSGGVFRELFFCILKFVGLR